MRSILPVMGVCILLFFSCTSENKEGQKEQEMILPVLEITKTDTQLLVDYVSDIQAVKNVEIRARVNGFLEKIFVDEGQNVKKGQLLF